MKAESMVKYDIKDNKSTMVILQHDPLKHPAKIISTTHTFKYVYTRTQIDGPQLNTGHAHHVRHSQSRLKSWKEWDSLLHPTAVLRSYGT